MGLMTSPFCQPLGISKLGSVLISTACCVTLGGSPGLPGPQAPQLKTGDKTVLLVEYCSAVKKNEECQLQQCGRT